MNQNKMKSPGSSALEDRDVLIFVSFKCLHICTILHGRKKSAIIYLVYTISFKYQRDSFSILSTYSSSSSSSRNRLTFDAKQGQRNAPTEGDPLAFRQRLGESPVKQHWQRQRLSLSMARSSVLAAAAAACFALGGRGRHRLHEDVPGVRVTVEETVYMDLPGGKQEEEKKRNEGEWGRNLHTSVVNSVCTWFGMFLGRT